MKASTPGTSSHSFAPQAPCPPPPPTAAQVSDLTPEEVMAEIELIVLNVTASILDGQACEYVVPTRTSSNQQYVEEVDRIVLKGQVSRRPFLSVGSVRKVGRPPSPVFVAWQAVRRSHPSSLFPSFSPSPPCSHIHHAHVLASVTSAGVFVVADSSFWHFCTHPHLPCHLAGFCVPGGHHHPCH